MKKKIKSKRLLSIFVTMVMVIGMLPMLPTISVSAKTARDRLDEIKQVYPAGKYFVADANGNNLNGNKNYPCGQAGNRCGYFGGGWQCKGFANYVFYQMFGLSLEPYPNSAPWTLSNNGSTYRVGELRDGSVNASSVKKLLLQARPGDIIQARHNLNGYVSQHSMIVNFVTDWGIHIYEGNYPYKCKVNERDVSHADFARQYHLGMTLNRATNYDSKFNDTPEPPPQPITPTVAQPTKSIQSTGYDCVHITLSCSTAGAEIRYTTNGSEPSKTNGALYPNGGFDVYSACEIKAKAFKSGYNASSTMTSSIPIPKLKAPEIKSSYTDNGAMVSISSPNNGAEIYYTTDGSAPNQNSKRFSSGFLVTDTTNIKAIAMKKGCLSSGITEKNVKMTVPDAPQLALYDTLDKIAQGDSVKIKWNSVESASNYKVKVYKNGKAVREIETKDTMMTYALEDAATYTLEVVAQNFKGDGPASNSIRVDAVAPLDVVFEDWDGKVLSESKVRYGYGVQPPENPTREGYDFTGWSTADLSCIRENTTITAQYNIKKFTVEFYDIDGKTKIGSSQRVEYQASASVPDASEVTQIKDNYKFNNWYVDPQSECKDYTCVTSDMKIIAKQIWADEMKPLLLTINSATLQEGNSYVADLTIESTDQSLTNFKLIGVLKTSSGRTVKATVIEENMKKAAQKNITYTINLIDHTDDGTATQNIATKMEIVAVGIEGENATGATLSEVVSADIEPEWTDWSDWSTEEAVDSDFRMVKTKQESRVRNLEYTTSNTSNNIGNGWELYDTTTSVGGWSGWSRSNPGSKTGRQIETRYVPPTYKTQHLYNSCTNGSRWHFCDGEARQYWGGSWWYIDTGWLDYELPYSSWGYSQYCAHTGVTYYGKYTTWGSSPYYYNHQTRQVQTGGGYNEYRYKDTTYTYKFRRWTAWSDWSESDKTGNDIEKRTLYSYSDKLTNPYDYSEIDENRTEYTIQGNLPSADDVSMDGRLATVLVYKDRNTDPTEAQLEHVEQITLGENGAYDFTFKPREEISEDTGNYIVALSVEGDSRLTNIEYIEAPKPKYTVKFIANGDVISEQEVEYGQDADVPAAPQVDGYTFVKWDDRTSYITADWTVNAVYDKNTYTIVFADFANENITMQTYNYQDEITPPSTDTMSSEGRTFKGWYVDVDGTKAYIDDTYMVANSAVLYADWDYDEYTVRFMNQDGTKAVSEQTVKYGESAELPKAPEASDGMVFMGWSTDIEWWNVKSDLTVHPIIVYETTASAPTYMHYPYGDGYNVVVLESETENASIYYTTDGSDPDMTAIGAEDSATKLYDAENGITITEDTEIKAITVAENTNASEEVSFNIAYEVFEIGENGIVSSISESNAKGKAGKQARVVFDISDNPGISALKLSATYDADVMKLAEIQNGSLFANSIFTPSPLSNNPIVMTWASAEDSTANGTLVTLVFDINEDAELGDYPIVFTAEANNAAEETIGVIKTTGFVSVVENEYGDANADGKVDLKDTIRILKSLSNWVVNIDDSAADVNADGIVSLLDVTRLLKFLADWDVLLGVN